MLLRLCQQPCPAHGQALVPTKPPAGRRPQHTAVVLEPVVHNLVCRDAHAPLAVRLLRGAHAHHTTIVVAAVVDDYRHLARVEEALAAGGQSGTCAAPAELLLNLHRDGDLRIPAAHHNPTHRVELRVLELRVLERRQRLVRVEPQPLPLCGLFATP